MHRHAQDEWEDYPKVKCVEIGPTVCIRRMGRVGKPEGFVAGFIISHEIGNPVTGETRCEGWVCVDPETASKDANGNPKVWTVAGNLEGGTLTLSPSILCTSHPEFHAYVQNGRWTG